MCQFLLIFYCICQDSIVRERLLTQSVTKQVWMPLHPPANVWGGGAGLRPLLSHGIDGKWRGEIGTTDIGLQTSPPQNIRGHLQSIQGRTTHMLLLMGTAREISCHLAVQNRLIYCCSANLLCKCLHGAHFWEFFSPEQSLDEISEKHILTAKAN